MFCFHLCEVWYDTAMALGCGGSWSGGAAVELRHAGWSSPAHVGSTIGAALAALAAGVVRHWQGQALCLPHTMGGVV
jgi:hypothetical protein